MKLWLLVLAVLISASAASNLKVAVLNDIHYDPYYDDATGIDKFWRNSSPLLEILGIEPLQSSQFGHFGWDSPRKLVELVLNRMKNIEPDVELILVTGDFLAHGFSVKVGDRNNYELIKQTIKLIFVDLLSSHFPKAIILPSIGNNDIKYHYRAPTQDDDANDYYSFFADVLFNQVEGNKKLKFDHSNSVLTNILKSQATITDQDLTFPDWAKTFLQRGYFRYDHKFDESHNGDSLSFISFNSLYYSIVAPVKQVDIMIQQLDWLEDQLKSSEPNRKFLIYFHIYPGEYSSNY